MLFAALLALVPLIAAQDPSVAPSSTLSTDSFTDVASPSSSDVTSEASGPSLTSSVPFSISTDASASSTAFLSSSTDLSSSSAAFASPAAPTPSAVANFTVATIPFEDMLPCRCLSGEVSYPQCRVEAPPPGQLQCPIVEADCSLDFIPYLGVDPDLSTTQTTLTEATPRKNEGSDLTDDELEVYKTMELEFYAEFLKNDPMYGEPRVSLPYCGLGDWQGTGELTRRGLFEKVFTGGRNIGEAIFGGRPVRPFCVPKRLSIPVHFHIFTTNCTSQNNVSDAAIQMSMDELNEAYGPMGISWTLGSLNRYMGPEYRDFTHNRYYLDGTDPNGNYANDFMVDPKYKKGGADQLNVFLVEQITNVPDKGGGTNGYCWPPGHPKYDGCLVKFDMLPGVSFQHPDTVSRKTLVHEAGHWLNLGHTHDEDAEDKVCSNTDDVADTVQNPYVGRFAQKQLPCKDGVLTAVPQPVYNWMSYAPIRNRFTTGQRAQAYAGFYFWRRGIRRPLSCNKVEVTYPPTKRSISARERLLALRQLPAMKKRSVLAQRPNILNELKAICSVPYLPTDDLSRSILDANADVRTVTDSEGSNRPVVQPPRGGTTPGGGEPTTPGGGDPSTPGGGNPTTPGGGDPTTPGGGDPATPGGGNPTEPGGGEPTIPGGGQPTTPGSGNPTTPGGGSPTTPGGGGEPASPGGGDPTADGGREIYHITEAGTKCLDVRYDWRYNGSPVQLCECNGTPAQKWIIQRGETKVRLAGTDFCLDAGEHPANFVSMKLWQCYDHLPAQQWWLTDDNRIAVKDQGQCLDLKDGIFEDWATVQTYKCTDYNTNQIWTV